MTALSNTCRLAEVASNDPLEQRDLGMIRLQVDRPGEAIDSLEAYVRAVPFPRMPGTQSPWPNWPREHDN